MGLVPVRAGVRLNRVYGLGQREAVKDHPADLPLDAGAFERGPATPGMLGRVAQGVASIGVHLDVSIGLGREIVNAPGCLVGELHQPVSC